MGIWLAPSVQRAHCEVRGAAADDACGRTKGQSGIDLLILQGCARPLHCY